MDESPLRFYYDYTDPLSYVAENALQALEAQLGAEVERHPLEVSPPPAALLDPQGPEWSERWRQAVRLLGEEGGAALRRTPALVPWTRKAHELALFAREKGRFASLHGTLFRAFFEQGEDLGRVDVLVRLAAGTGLPAMETRAVLDVDRFAAEVVALGREAERAGVGGVPTLLVGGSPLQGVAAVGALRALLRGEPPTSDLIR